MIALHLVGGESKLRETESDVLDLEDVLAFARKIVTSPARLWLESSIDQRQKLQWTFFPNGLTFDGEEFGTPASSLFFSLLGGISEDRSLLASPTGFEPVLSPRKGGVLGRARRRGRTFGSQVGPHSLRGGFRTRISASGTPKHHY